MKSSYEQKHIQRESQENERNPNLEEHQKDSVWKMASYFTRRKVDLSIRTRIDNEISYTTFHEGSGDSSLSKAMSAHLGRNPTYEQISARFFLVWNIRWRFRLRSKVRWMPKTEKFASNVKNEPHSVPVSPNAMKQIGVDLCSLSAVDGYWQYCHLIVCIDYFSKWTEAKPSSNGSTIFVWADVSPWLRRDSNKRTRTRICQCCVEQFTRIDWRRTTCYFSIPS